MKRDLRKAEEEEKWREKANNRDQWKQITKVAVLRSDQSHPYTREPDEEQVFVDMYVFLGFHFIYSCVYIYIYYLFTFSITMLKKIAL